VRVPLRMFSVWDGARVGNYTGALQRVPARFVSSHTSERLARASPLA
jgi:hypothetical protein